MSVNIIDTLKPKNGLNFPVVEAIDVFVENYENLADLISHFATDTMIAAINAVLSGKANTDDVNAAVANLQNQINQIEISASAEAVVAPEVAGARVGADGTSYQTLKSRLDVETQTLNGNILSITEGTKNIWSPDWLKKYKEGSEYIATANQLNATPDITFSAASGKRYTLSFEAYTEQNDSSSGNGVQVYFNLSGTSTKSSIYLSNSTSNWQRFTVTSTSGMTVASLGFSYSSSGANIWHFRNFQLEQSSTATDYEPYFNAQDRRARESISAVNSEIDSLEPTIKMVYDQINYTAADANTHYVNYKMYSGVTYTVRPTSGITFVTRNANNEELQSKSMFADRDNEFVCSADAVKFSFYSAAGVEVFVTRNSTLAQIVPQVKTETEQNSSSIETLDNQINGGIDYTATTTGTIVFPYKVHNGETYIVRPNVGMTISTRETSSGSDIQSKSLFANRDNVFVCTADANYIKYYASTENSHIVIKRVGSITYDIENINNTLFKLTDGIPDYFDEQIDTAIPIIRENMNACGRNGDTFIFITDVHWGGNRKNSPYLIRKILNNTNIRMIICGGDLISQGEREEMIEVMTDCVQAFKFPDVLFPVAFGNHDGNWNDYAGQHEHPERYFTLATTYALMGKQTDKNVEWFDHGDFSFWFDNPTTKTRYIVLDTGEDGNIPSRIFTDYDTLAATMMSVNNDWKIIIVAHIVTYGNFTEGVEPMLDAYNNKSVYGNYDFTSAKGTVVMGIGGHTHVDSNHTTTGGIPIIVTSCDTLDTAHGAVANTVDEQCFDVVTVDYDNQTIKCVRIGRGSDRTIEY